MTVQQQDAAPAFENLRDLNEEEFAARYDTDRFTASVLSSRFRYVVDHMVSALHRVAFSPVLRTGDLAATLSGPPELGFAMPAVSRTLPYFVGTVPDGVRIALEEYGVESLKPGDVIMANDVYRMGNHLNDVCFIQPLFRDGAIVGATTMRCHMMDWGGRIAGGFDTTKTDTYVDGLVFPPTLLFDGGKVVEPLLKFIVDNTRFGSFIVPDMFAIKSSLAMGEALILESIEKYGLPAYLGSIRYTCDASWESMRDGLAMLPDGEYCGEHVMDTDTLPDSEPYRVRAKIKKHSDRAEVDFSGSSHSARTAINSAWLDAKTGVGFALKCLLDPTGRFTSASLRNIDLLVPPDSIVNASPPHSCHFYFEVQEVVMMAIYAALNPVLGAAAVAHDATMNMHIATGVTKDGEPWWLGRANGTHSPWGGSEQGDGDTQQKNIFLNMPVSAIEEDEVFGPCVAISLDLVPDSGGAGQHRGGNARFIDSYWLGEADHSCISLHVRTPPAGGGVNGGRAGLLGGCWIWEGDDATVDFAVGLPRSLQHESYRRARPMYGVLDPVSLELAREGEYVWSGAVHAGPGAVVRAISNGAGGWGNAFDRDPERVLDDVRNEYVSIRGAAADYGVVVVGDPVSDPEGLIIDAAATQALRQRAAQVRTP